MARAWAWKGRALYGGTTLAVLAVVIGVPAYFLWFSTTPTCTDGRQNQDEVGVDCGGSCAKLCEQQTVSPNVLWSRAFRVSEGVYNVVAYIENPNFNAGAFDVPYRFRLVDNDNVLVAERTGTTYISPRMTFPVFVASVQTGNRIPARAFFSFTEEPSWRRVDASAQRALNIAERMLTNPDGQPRVTATINNEQVGAIADIEVVAVVFDTNGNAMASSRTIIDELSGGNSRDVVFTWPEAFPRDVGRVDVVPRIPPNRRGD